MSSNQTANNIYRNNYAPLLEYGYQESIFFLWYSRDKVNLFEMQIYAMNNKKRVCYFSVQFNQNYARLNICLRLMLTSHYLKQYSLQFICILWVVRACVHACVCGFHSTLSLPFINAVLILQLWAYSTTGLLFSKCLQRGYLFMAQGKYRSVQVWALHHYLLQVTDYSVMPTWTESWLFFCSLYWIRCGISVIKDLPTVGSIM